MIDDYSAKIVSLILTFTPREFNGVILITQNGKTKYSKEYGFSNFKEQTPIKLNDNFLIQSNSKQITAVLILKEVEKGNIDLNKTVHDYLPEIKADWTNSVTIHNLLNMSAGINYFNNTLLFEPGNGFMYNNKNYGLLGKILQKVTDRKFKELSMNNTYCYEYDKPNKGIINSYELGSFAYPVEFKYTDFTKDSWENYIPAGGIVSNVFDLNIWDNKLHNGEILSSDLYKQMTTPTNMVKHSAFDNETTGYGYGIRTHSQHKTLYIGHGGKGLGFVSFKFYIPKSKVDVIILENIYYKSGNSINNDIIYHFENEIRKIVAKSSLGRG